MHKKEEGDKQDIWGEGDQAKVSQEMTFKQRGRRDTLGDRGGSCRHLGPRLRVVVRGSCISSGRAGWWR